MKVSDDRLVAKWNSLKVSAAARGLDFKLTLTGLRNVLGADKCRFTKLRIDGNTSSIDRIDSRKGYVTGNVAACHRVFNSVKGVLENPNTALSVDELLEGFAEVKKLRDRVRKAEGLLSTGQGAPGQYREGDLVSRVSAGGNLISLTKYKVISMHGTKVTLGGCSRAMKSTDYVKVTK